jgi:hypothetical protein
MMGVTYSEVINVSGEGHHDWRGDALLEQTAELAL